MNDYSKNFSFIKLGHPVVPKGKKEIVYILEIFGNDIHTTNGIYKKEELTSVIEIAKLIEWLNYSQN